MNEWMNEDYFGCGVPGRNGEIGWSGEDIGWTGIVFKNEERVGDEIGDEIGCCVVLRRTL